MFILWHHLNLDCPYPLLVQSRTLPLVAQWKMTRKASLDSSWWYGRISWLCHGVRHMPTTRGYKTQIHNNITVNVYI